MDYKKMYMLSKDAKLIRQEVFVDEQHFENEFDTIDDLDTTAHLVFYQNNQPIAVCRYFPDDAPDTYILGRLAVRKKARGQHLGKDILQVIEESIRKDGGKLICLSAQERVKDFYTKSGYRASGDIYYDEYCPHIRMEKHLS